MSTLETVIFWAILLSALAICCMCWTNREKIQDWLFYRKTGIRKPSYDEIAKGRKFPQRSETLVMVSGMIDRFLFGIAMLLTIIFAALRLFGKINLAWMWVLSPFLIWLILSFLRMQLIVKPTMKRKMKQMGKD